MNVDHEIKLLVQEIQRLGSPNANGNISVKFGVLFADDRCANLFEGMVWKGIYISNYSQFSYHTWSSHAFNLTDNVLDFSMKSC